MFPNGDVALNGGITWHNVASSHIWHLIVGEAMALRGQGEETGYTIRAVPIEMWFEIILFLGVLVMVDKVVSSVKFQPVHSSSSPSLPTKAPSQSEHPRIRSDE